MSEDIQAVIRDALKDSNIGFDKVNFIYLFGSYVDDPDNAEDIDVAVSLELDNSSEAEYKLKGRVPERFDVSVFENLPLQVKNEVFKGELVYTRDKKVYDTAFKVFREYETFEPLYKTAIGAKR